MDILEHVASLAYIYLKYKIAKKGITQIGFNLSAPAVSD